MALSHTREKIVRHVAANPGVHLRGIVRDLDLAHGQVQYHLRRLRGDGRLVREAYAGRTHFFPPDVDASTRRQLAIIRRETARDVCLSLAENGPAPPSTVAEDLGVARSTLEWHLEGLVAEELVAKRRDGAGQVTLALVDSERVGRRLEAVEPTTPARLADRFTRLVDGLLYDD